MEDRAPGSAADEDEEKKRLLQKIKDASNGPEFAARRIRELDKTVKRLKQNRLDCQRALDVDQARLEGIRKRIVSVEDKRKQVQARLAERRALRGRLQTQLDELAASFAGVLEHTKGHARTTRLTAARFVSKHASETLVAERGFSTSRHERPYASPSGRNSRSSSIRSPMASGSSLKLPPLSPGQR